MDVQLGDYDIHVEVIRKRNKNIYFRFKDGIMYVTCNRLVSLNEINKLIKQNEKSLLRMYEKEVKKIEKDLRFYYLGNEYTVVYDSSIKHVYIDEDMLYTKDEKMLNKWLKEECERVFKEEIRKIVNDFYGIPPFSLRIRKMSTRWGVNNVTKRIITLNSELIKRDVSLIDYVIVHELCHFYEANHSSRFWYQVSLRYPNYSWARKELRS